MTEHLVLFDNDPTIIKRIRQTLGDSGKKEFPFNRKEPRAEPESGRGSHLPTLSLNLSVVWQNMVILPKPFVLLILQS